MREVFIISVPGTWETRDATKPMPPTGMTALVHREFGELMAGERHDWHVTNWSVPYTSGYGDKASYESSVAKGKRNLKSMLKAVPPGALIFLVGYSQGATIAGDVFLEWVQNSEGLSMDDLEIEAYYGISDPRRNPGEIIGPDPGGQGITGARGDFRWASRRVYQFCAPGDIIASSDPGTDLFQEISVFTNRFWVGDVLGWVGYSLSILGSPSFQKRVRDEYGYKGVAGYLSFRSKLRRTVDRGINYLRSNVHTSYGKYKVGKRTVPEWIANDIARKLSEMEPS
ncbi:lysin B [Gordonia phage PokyPuppy]|nr:lysin B [Gordonia phage PokyPuppy]